MKFILLTLLTIGLSYKSQQIKGEWEINNFSNAISSNTNINWSLTANSNNAWGKTKITFTDSTYKIIQNEKEALYPNSKTQKTDTIFIQSEFNSGKYKMKKDTLILYTTLDLIDVHKEVKDTIWLKALFKSDTLYLKSL
tara:strand:+ start:53 stop:469 length:417 start_codon:yes stop_codon:yes gene_type:complete